MNKVYLILPLIGLLIFGGIYMNFSQSHEAKLAAIKTKEVEAKKEKIRKQEDDRKKAVAAALETSKIRTEENARKKQIEEDKKNAREAAEDKRLRANSDKNKLTDQARRLKKDLEDVQDEIKKTELAKKTLIDEQAFLKTYVKQAESNVKYYYDLLDKITLAEKARAKAAADAAAAAKKS